LQECAKAKGGGAISELSKQVELVPGEAELKERIVELAAAAAKRREDLETEIHALRDEEKRWKAALRALDPDHPLVQPKAGAGRPKAGGTSSYYDTSRAPHDALEEVAAWVEKRPRDEFSVPEVIEEMNGFSHDTIRRSIRFLRAQEALLFTGKRRRNGAEGGRTSEHYKLSTVEELHRAVELNRERTGG
jgi:hypothetical protein